MLREISAQEFIEWVEYAKLEPFDEERADYRTAAIRETLANINRDSKTKPNPYTLEEMLVRFGDAPPPPAPPPQDWKSQKAIGKSIMKLANRDVARAPRRRTKA